LLLLEVLAAQMFRADDPEGNHQASAATVRKLGFALAVFHVKRSCMGGTLAFVCRLYPETCLKLT
jgi:hypothetical protein